MTEIINVRTRFAPSPTGHLHIGNARTALFNWLFARHCGGRFILRIEDTDPERSEREFEESISEDLRWLGIEWDEGPDKGGSFAPYRQSERTGIYKAYADKLMAEGNAYYCFCTEERLSEVRKNQMKAGWPPKYDGRCRTIAKQEISTGSKPVIRFRVPEKTVVFEDKIHKKLTFNASQFGDFVIVGSDGAANYNFAVVIDDAMMGITHIIRGEDHLSNTPRQILLYEAMGFHVPEFGHVPLILGADRAPLSKRHGAAAIRDLKDSGYLSEAILNHLCHLGHSPEKELLSIDEAIRTFSLEKISRSPSVFDIERLKAFNRAYLGKADSDRLYSLAERYYSTEDVPVERLKIIIDAVKGEASTIKELCDVSRPFLKEPAMDDEAMNVLKEESAGKILSALTKEINAIDQMGEMGADSYKKIIANIKHATGENGKRLFMPIRAALTGSIKGIELEKIFMLLGRDEILMRAHRHVV